MRSILYTILLLFIVSGAHSQIIETAPEYNPSLRAKAYQQSLYPQILNADDTLNLPFLDDFNYAGPFPSTSNWCDDATFVNHTLSINPPTVGVVTLDGLDGSGSPYNLSGTGDTLTSKAFYMGTYTATDQVYLSFYYQPKGYGDRPETADSLILEFKDVDDNWIVYSKKEGIPDSIPEFQSPDFEFNAVLIPDSYYYDGFQFRFRNITSGKGQVDIWHLDYIRLTANITPTTNFSDVAFTEDPGTFLSSYTAMPWRQYQGFESSETKDGYTLTLFNHFPDIQEIQNRIVTIRETKTNTQVLSTNFLTDAGAPIPLGNVDPGIHIQADKILDAASYGNFVNDMSSLFNGEDELLFETTYTYTQTGEDPAFPASIANNTIKRHTVFSDYFAYDDGTAESNVKAQNPGTDIAVKFTMNIPDSLRAIQMHIPHVAGDATTQLFNIKVYQDLDAEPVYEANFQSPVYVDEFVASDTLQGLTTYVLKNNLGEPAPIFLPAGDFYIGWEQVTDTDTPIPIGFDRNNINNSANNFFNAGGGWEPFPNTLQGAIMIRPVVGETEIFSTSTSDLEASTYFDIYPNPANEIIIFSTLNGQSFDGGIEIFDVAGRRVWSSTFQEFIPVVDFNTGIYFIQLTDWETGIRYNEKVMIQH